MFKTIIILSVLTIVTIHCGKSNATANTTTAMFMDQMVSIQGCPLLFYYNNESQKCECLSSSVRALESMVACANGRARLRYSRCMTYTEETNTVSVSFCAYFTLNGHNISEPGFISLPENISDLNDYMCGPMNRKSILCSECIDGYGPSSPHQTSDVPTVQILGTVCHSICYWS